MKRIFFAVMFVVTLTLASTCAAQDVWVDHWSSENIDIYAMDDTIRGDTKNGSRYFKVSTKYVRNGQLQKVVNWTFSKYQTDMWRYETSTMDGSHTTVVMAKSKLFEFCMNRLGWSYRIQEPYYYY